MAGHVGDALETRLRVRFTEQNVDNNNQLSIMDLNLSLLFSFLSFSFLFFLYVDNLE